MYQVVSIYRCVSFGKPRGPWRIDPSQAHRDAEQQGLGSFDERGFFWSTVPGDIEVMHLPASLVRAAAAAISGERAAA